MAVLPIEAMSTIYFILYPSCSTVGFEQTGVVSPLQTKRVTYTCIGVLSSHPLWRLSQPLRCTTPSGTLHHFFRVVLCTTSSISPGCAGEDKYNAQIKVFSVGALGSTRTGGRGATEKRIISHGDKKVINPFRALERPKWSLNLQRFAAVYPRRCEKETEAGCQPFLHVTDG